MATLQIQLLGEFRLLIGDQPITTVNQARQQALLAYLLLHRHAPQPRQHLAFLFWPDTNETQAQTNLRNLVYKTRQALPNADQFLLADTQTIQWRPNTPFQLDVADFETALQDATRQALEQAVSHYRGELLPSCYDDWVRSLREELQQKAISALEQLIALLEAERAYRPAITHTQRLLHLDPLNEKSYCTLIRLQAANGDRAGALHSYQQCVALLQRELGVPPAPSTQELYQRLLTNSALSSSSTSAVPPQPFVGRTAEWQTLLKSWYNAGSGKSHCLLLTGEAGIGKTRLAEELLAWVTRQGFMVATARCYPVEGALAYAPIVAWLRNERLRQRWAMLEPVWLTELARLLPELMSERPALPAPAPFTEKWQRQRLFEAVSRALASTEGQRETEQNEALLLFVDDLQWCDQDTLAWLHYVLRTKPQVRLLILGTVRMEEVLDEHPLLTWLAELRRDRLVTEVILDRLDAAETAALADQIAKRSLTPAERTHLYQATEGNPLFVVESIQALATPEPATMPTSDERIGRWARGELTATPPVFPLPPTLQAVIGRRLAHLSAPARAVAGLAATIGRAFAFPVLARASQHDEESLVNQLDELCQHRILCEHGADGYDFTHDRLREVAYSTLSTARRRLLHRRVAEALATTYAARLDQVSGQIAAHYELADLVDQAIGYYQRAAAVARQLYANADAIRYYRAALALFAQAPGQTTLSPVTIAEALGDLLHLITHFAEACAAYTEALRHYPASPAAERARLHCKIGNCQRDSYDYPAAQASYGEALKELGATPPTSTADETADLDESAWWQEWLQIHLELYMLYYWLNAVDASVELDQWLQPLLAQHGTRNQQVSYLLNRNRLDLMHNHFHVTPAMVRSVREALALLQQMDDQARIPATIFSLGFNLLWSDDPQGALEPLHTALQLAEQRGDTNLQTRCLAYLAVAYRRCERLVETQQFAERTQAVALVTQMPEYTGMSLANLGWVAWRRGDRGTAQNYGEAALKRWERSNVPQIFIWTAIWPLLAVAQAEQQFPTAVTYIRQLFAQSPYSMSAALTSLLEQASQAWETGQVGQTDQLLQQAILLAQRARYL